MSGRRREGRAGRDLERARPARACAKRGPREIRFPTDPTSTGRPGNSISAFYMEKYLIQVGERRLELMAPPLLRPQVNTAH